MQRLEKCMLRTMWKMICGRWSFIIIRKRICGEEIFYYMAEHRLPIYEMKMTSKSLEDVFLELTKEQGKECCCRRDDRPDGKGKCCSRKFTDSRNNAEGGDRQCWQYGKGNLRVIYIR